MTNLDRQDRTRAVVCGWLPVWLAGAGVDLAYDGPWPAEWASSIAEALRGQWERLEADYRGPAAYEDIDAAVREAAPAVAGSLPPSLREAARTSNRAVLDALEAAHLAWALYAVEALHAGAAMVGWRAELTITADRAAAALQHRGIRTA